MSKYILFDEYIIQNERNMPFHVVLYKLFIHLNVSISSYVWDMK